MFSQAVVDEICHRLAEGQSLRAVCRDPEMPSAQTVLRWLEEPDKASFAEQYASARARQYALLGDEILQIVDEAEDMAKARLQFDARRWMLSKMLPKVYGDKLDVAHSGGVTVVMTPTDAAL